MAFITDATTTWSAPVTLAADEIWQARKGRVFLTTTASPDMDDGIELHEIHAVRLSAGADIRYRKEAAVATLIVRETV